MKRIIISIFSIISMLVSTSVFAQGYYAEHHIPARGYNDPYSHSFSSRFLGKRAQRKAKEYNQTQYTTYVVTDGLSSSVVTEKIYTSDYSKEFYNACFDSHAPNRWVYGRHGMPYWPVHYMNNEPFYWYPTPTGSIAYYSSTNIMIGVLLDEQILLIREQNDLYIWNTKGCLLKKLSLYAGMRTYFEMKTRQGSRLVGISYNGVCQVDLLDKLDGVVLESYKIL